MRRTRTLFTPSIQGFGHPALRRKSRRISPQAIRSPEVQRLIKEMFRALRNAHGVGLAASQVGVPHSLVVINIPSGKSKFRGVILNPQIISRSKSNVPSWEGCLSLPGMRGKVQRSRTIRVRFRDENAEQHDLKVSGYLSRVFQHEIDHLQGILFLDRNLDLRSVMTAEEYRSRVS
jgi:peptide deformylase